MSSEMLSLVEILAKSFLLSADWKAAAGKVREIVLARSVTRLYATTEYIRASSRKK